MSTYEVSITFTAILLLLTSSFIFGKLFELIKAPKVVGEIVGGMIVGGSCMNILLPDISQMIFNGYTGQDKVLNLIYQLGLVFLMFSSGYNTTITLNKSKLKNYILLFTGATIVPMTLGLPFINLFINEFIGTKGNNLSFSIVFIISVAITSIPVISKIFFDINMMNTNFSNMVITVSTIQDLCLWILLNISISIVEQGEVKIISLISTTLITIGIILIANILNYTLNKFNIKLENNIITVSFIITFTLIIILNTLNINIMYSSFVAGYIMKSLVPVNNKDINIIKQFSTCLFIPVYFALVGYKIDIINNFSFIRFLTFFIIAFSLEFIGTVSLLLFTKLKRKTIISLGITMNARGGPGIVLATTALSYDIINIEFFTVLILTTMLSSAIAGYWLNYFKDDIKDEG